MAKKFVKISLATKFRVLFGAAVLGVIVAALLVPWYFMELLAERGVERPAAELTRLRLNEYVQDHRKGADAAAQDANSKVVAFYTTDTTRDGFKGPTFVPLTIAGASSTRPAEPLSGPRARARQIFERSADQDLALLPSEDEHDRAVYRCFRAVRIEPVCADCHKREGRTLPAQTGQLVGLIDLTTPASAASGTLVWLTRGAFAVGAALASLLAFFLFVLITQRLVLRPLRQLRAVSDKVAEGDLTVRSTIRTGDELERLGASFNEMLQAITDQHEKLRAANRALDLKLNELSEANTALAQANRVKNEFLANVSHELRTPLNSIIGFADLLADRTDEKVQRYGQNISQSAKSLLGMINDLLDLAKIEAGKVDVRVDMVSVIDACQTLVTLMTPLADKKQIELRWQAQGEIPLVHTDAAKLQQILYNLLSNAVKFTPAGGKVALSAAKVSVQRNDKPAEEVAVSVADTGPGIPEADQKHIFEKFFQGDRSLTKETSGTGLGLSIARELTQLLGGRLTLKSEPGHGTEFTLHLPVAGPAEATAPAAGQ